MHQQQTFPISFLQEHGYAVIPDVFSKDEISVLARTLAHAPLRRSRAGARHILSVPAVREISEDLRLKNIARALLGDSAVPFRATLFDKSPASNWLVTWHQDTALPLAEKIETPGWGPWSVKEGVIYSHAPTEALDQVVALRLHLDDSTEKNGPLRVVPKTHGEGVMTDSEIHDISSRISATECTVARGGVIAMRPLVIHASSKSENDAPRRVLHIEFSAQLRFENGLCLAIA